MKNSDKTIDKWIGRFLKGLTFLFIIASVAAIVGTQVGRLFVVVILVSLVIGFMIELVQNHVNF